MSHPPPTATVQQVHDATAWAIEKGHATLPVRLDRRGIQYLQPTKHDTVGLGMPPVEEMLTPTAFYLRAIF